MFKSICVISTHRPTRNEYLQQLIGEHHLHAADIFTLENTVIGISQIKELLAFAANKPYASSYKLISIDGDALTPEAQQALLKTLEEPPAYTQVVIFAASEYILLPTIMSRCFIKYMESTASDLPQSTTDNENIKKYWQTLLQSSAGKRIKEATNVATEREAVLEWLKTHAHFLRNELHQGYKNQTSFLTPSHCAEILKEIQNAYNHTKRNISLKLIIDTLFLNLPYRLQQTNDQH